MTVARTCEGDGRAASGVVFSIVNVNRWIAGEVERERCGNQAGGSPTAKSNATIRHQHGGWIW